MTPRKRLVGLERVRARLRARADGLRRWRRRRAPRRGRSTGIVTSATVSPEPADPARTNEIYGGLVVTKHLRRPQLLRRRGCSAQRDRRVDRVRRQQDLERDDPGRLEVVGRYDVTAKSFVDAWNWAGYGPNGATSPPSSRPSRASTNQGEPEIDDEGNVTGLMEEPTAETLSGLARVRERHRVHGHAQPAGVRLPDPSRLLGVLPAARGVLRRPRGVRHRAGHHGRQRAVHAGGLGARLRRSAWSRTRSTTARARHRTAAWTSSSTPTRTPPTTTCWAATSTSSRTCRPRPSRPSGGAGRPCRSTALRHLRAMTVPEWVAEFSGRGRPEAPSRPVDGDQPRADHRDDLRRCAYPARGLHLPVIAAGPMRSPATRSPSTTPKRPRRSGTRPTQRTRCRATTSSTIHTNTDSTHQEWVEAVCNGYRTTSTSRAR